MSSSKENIAPVKMVRTYVRMHVRYSMIIIHTYFPSYIYIIILFGVLLIWIM